MSDDSASPEWIAGLKPGDPVTRFIPGSSPQYRTQAGVVERVTASQVMLVGRRERYRRDDGFEITTGSRYERARLLPGDHPSVQTALRLTLVAHAFQLSRHYERAAVPALRMSPAELHAALIQIRDAFATAARANEPA